jgi:uncharacterized protein
VSSWAAGIVAALILLLPSCARDVPRTTSRAIIDIHRHAPWPGDPDAEGLKLIRDEMRANDVVASVLMITGREDVGIYEGEDGVRFILSPMFPCPPLTSTRKWCFTETPGMMPDADWLDRELSAGKLQGIGELAFNYAGLHPDDPKMAPFWALAAKHDVPAFVHSGRGPEAGQGPRRHAGCCPDYRPEYGNPALLRPILLRHSGLRLVLLHVGFDHLDETIALMRDFPNVYADMSVLNSVGPRDLHDSSLRRLVEAGLSDRIMLGSDDFGYGPIIERIEGAAFLTEAQRRGIYYDNAARFLRLPRRTAGARHER